MTHTELALTQTDWSRFLTPEGLAEKSGTSRANFPRMILKELADNAADAGGASLVVIDADTVMNTDTGPGIAVTDLSDVFSIKRPLVSTKHWRMNRPQPCKKFHSARHQGESICNSSVSRMVCRPQNKKSEALRSSADTPSRCT